MDKDLIKHRCLAPLVFQGSLRMGTRPCPFLWRPVDVPAQWDRSSAPVDKMRRLPRWRSTLQTRLTSARQRTGKSVWRLASDCQIQYSQRYLFQRGDSVRAQQQHADQSPR